MKYLRILSVLLIFLMNFDFSKENYFSCYTSCMKKIKRAGSGAHFCIVKNGLKTLGKLAPGGGLLDIIMPGSFRDCDKLIKNTSDQINIIDKECRAKCQKYKK